MAHSMTAYANRSTHINGVIVQWDIRSVNHRYLELSFKLPDSLKDVEYTMRDIVRNSLNRGKVDCTLKLDWIESKPVELMVDYRLVEALTEASERIMERLPSGKSQVLSPFDILKWPSVVRIPDKDLSAVLQPIQQSFKLTLQDLIECRKREGSKLEILLQERLVKMHQILNNINARIPEIQKNFRAKLIEKLNGLNFELDKNRFEQEMVYLMQKMDISEELDRLSTHLSEVKRVLISEKIMGKRLDFLMQELNRETNTIASKAIDNASIQNSVELKVLIEEMREQIQNLE